MISHGVLDHMYWEEAGETVEEVARVLRPWRLFYISLVSTKESGYGLGEEVAQHTFILTDGAEKGAVQRFYESADIFKMLNRCFKVLDIVRDEW